MKMKSIVEFGTSFFDPHQIDADIFPILKGHGHKGDDAAAFPDA